MKNGFSGPLSTARILVAVMGQILLKNSAFLQSEL
jgi:hypothetical protein